MRIYILSLGCAKNRVDSECLAGELVRAGHIIADEPSSADIGIVNTCGFIRPAVEESISAILELEELKQKGILKKIGVVGCLLNRYGNDLKKEIPSIDFWAKSEDWATVLENLDSIPNCGRCRYPLPSSLKFTRYLKISEGCDNRCTYCAIHSIRGGLRSLSINTVVKEAEQLVCEGVREICVVGQDLTVYGTDVCGKSRLIELLDALENSLPKNIWIRLLYLHPSRVGKDLLERVASGTQIIPYLDIPVQHGDSEILSLMNRGITDETLIDIFRTARAINPDFALRTTCMVGFPGEKKKHFDKMLRFIENAKFDRMGAFTFFREEGTEAYAMEAQVPEAVKNRRLASLMALQEEISSERQQLFVGRELDVLIEKINREEGFAEGRSYREAPEVDGIVEVRNIRQSLQEGDIIKVRMTDAMPHDMIGEEAAK